MQKIKAAESDLLAIAATPEGMATLDQIGTSGMLVAVFGSARYAAAPGPGASFEAITGTKDGQPIDIVKIKYDAGTSSKVNGLNGGLIDQPSYLTLAHELSHALTVAIGGVGLIDRLDNTPLGPTYTSIDQYNAVQFENDIRCRLQLPLADPWGAAELKKKWKLP